MRTAMIFDLDEFIDECRAGLAETDSPRAIRDVVRRVMTHPGAVADALRPETGGVTVLHHAPDLTVLHIVWAPGMRITPHNHGMRATIGINAGQEDNTPSTAALSTIGAHWSSRVAGNGASVRS